jgi:glycosyltransferase involved in cell wall biosynthesis
VTRQNTASDTLSGLGRVAIVHDYLTQRGGAERVVLAMMRAFPDAQLHTSLYSPDLTFPEFRQYQIRTLPMNWIRPLRRHHRAALPLLAPSFTAHRVDADLVICSTSGWAHGVRTRGRKLVYCHAPARWLYQSKLYVGSNSRPGRPTAARVALATLKRPLLHWDRRAARSADVYVVTSRAVQVQVRDAYGIDAYVLPPPVADMSDHTATPVAGIEPGYLLCVSRLLPYKNVDVLLEAMRRLPKERLVVAGSGPQLKALRAIAPTNARLLDGVTDEQLVWLYHNSSAVVAPSYEDFGLVPVEAAMFGKPTAALRFGGFLDTVLDGETGVLFGEATPKDVAQAIALVGTLNAPAHVLVAHAQHFRESAFAAGLIALARSTK